VVSNQEADIEGDRCHCFSVIEEVSSKAFNVDADDLIVIKLVLGADPSQQEQDYAEVGTESQLRLVQNFLVDSLVLLNFLIVVAQLFVHLLYQVIPDVEPLVIQTRTLQVDLDDPLLNILKPIYIVVVFLLELAEQIRDPFF